MKLRALPFAGALVLALGACPGPQQMSPAKPADITPLQKQLPTPTNLADPTQIDPKDGTVLVLMYDGGAQAYLAYQVDPPTATVRRAFKIETSKVGAVLLPDRGPTSTLDIIRVNPPPPPPGDDLLRALVNLAVRIHPRVTVQPKAFEPNAPVAK